MFISEYRYRKILKSDICFHIHGYFHYKILKEQSNENLKTYMKHTYIVYPGKNHIKVLTLSDFIQNN